MKISVHNKTLVLFLSQLLSLLVSKACHSVDKQALLHFKHNIISDPSKLLHSWSLSSDCCSAWEGVACDPSGRVVNLSRPGLVSGSDFLFDTNLKDLKGPIPPEFGSYLTSLISSLIQTISLARYQRHFATFLNWRSSILVTITYLLPFGIRPIENRLSGPIPTSIGKLVLLTKFDLHGNNISGSIPLKSLIYLDLSGNRISGRLPQSIVAVSQLGLLYLSHNQLNGSIPCSISGLNSLLFCQLSQNKLAGALPASPGQLPKIERLFFENNKLSGKLPAIIGHLAILTDIFFSNNRFTGKIPSSFSNLHNLQTVDLSTNRFIGQIPPQLAKLQRLDTLDLSFNPLGLISVPSFFARLKLFRLSLEKTGIEGQLPYLHHLSPYLTYQAIP
ncbi:hypothetical protein DVH24_029775 [Malus domestica]|uniref:Leucine-rich repeat-containing N-terminal plant-type domain-containing protein n=1 Tax=Malus domestica TaxID=3750 RepID=A0A498HY31_MALDO|nr:hypothetical protein DVH24_029775 [Malus domestica]